MAYSYMCPYCTGGTLNSEFECTWCGKNALDYIVKKTMPEVQERIIMKYLLQHYQGRAPHGHIILKPAALELYKKAIKAQEEPEPHQRCERCGMMRRFLFPVRRENHSPDSEGEYKTHDLFICLKCVEIVGSRTDL